MPGSVIVNEALGQPTIPASADYAVCVIGYTTSNPLGAGPGPVSAQYSQPASLAADYGLGDAVDCALQAIVQTQGNPAPPPIAIYPTPATTPGERGDLDTDGVTGTATITQTADTEPVGTYEPVVRVVDDGNDGDGGLIGTAGIVLEGSVDGGRTWLPSEALGTAVTWKLRLRVDGTLTDTGVQYDIGPSTTNAAYVALAVELREEVLDHLANVTAHDGADTSAAQVALAASSVPSTVAQSTAVVNLVLAALVSHVVNITSVHDGQDKTAYTALALLSAATNTKEGIDLAIALKAIYEAHRAATYSNSAAGLKAATATIASPTTYTAAADFLSGGVVALDANPRRLVFTTANGSGSASDAPATVDIAGFDYAGNAQTETGLAIAQTNGGTATSTKAWKGTGLSVTYAAADGTGATIAIGYANGVHNSADSTNTVTSSDPTYGTLKTGDTWGESKTTPPMWGAADLYDAGGPSGAFYGIGRSTTSFAILVISEPVTADDFATLTAGLDYLLGLGKRVSLLVRFRDPTDGETDAAYVAAFQTFVAANQDNRISCVAGNGWLTEPFRGYRYYRSGLPALLARMQSFQAVPGAIGERIAQHPGFVGRGPLENFSIVDDDGNPIEGAHDEALVSGIDGPITGFGGGITFYYQRQDAIRGTYVSEAPVMYGALSRILTWMDRRVANGIETIAATIAWTEIQGANVFDPGPPPTLDPDLADAIQSKIAKAISDRYAGEFQNAADRNLVVVNPSITVDGAQVTIMVTINVRFYGYTHTIQLTFSASR